MTIDELKTALEAMPEGTWLPLAPRIFSYRGAYDQPAIGHGYGTREEILREIADVLKGRSERGYKDLESGYYFHGGQSLHVAKDYSDCSFTRLESINADRRMTVRSTLD